MFVVVAPLMDADVPFKLSDFTPVGLIGGQPNVFAVPNSLPVRTLKEFVEYAKLRPGKLNTTVFSRGGSTDLATLAFMRETGVQLALIGYKGMPQATPDLVRGDLSIVLAPISTLSPQVNAGTVRALAVNSQSRAHSLPDVPTLDEAGFSPDLVVMPWFGLFAPAGTPPQIVARLNEELNKALKAPEVVQAFKTSDIFIMGGGPASEFGQLLKTEEVRWAKVVKQ
jgi:tripartite-type tricarboxylate transporter receptor subunit TctC